MVVRIIGGKKKAIARAKLSAAIRREKSYTQKIHIPKTGKTTTYVVSNGKRTFIGSEQTSEPQPDTQPRSEANVVTEIDSQQAAGEYATQLEQRGGKIGFFAGVAQAAKEKYGISFGKDKPVYSDSDPYPTKKDILMDSPSSGPSLLINKKQFAKGATQLTATYGVFRYGGSVLLKAPGPVKVVGLTLLGGTMLYDVVATGYKISKASDPAGAFGYELAAQGPYFVAAGKGFKGAGKKISSTVSAGTRYTSEPVPTGPGGLKRGQLAIEGVVTETKKITYGDLPKSYKYVKKGLPTTYKKVTVIGETQPFAFSRGGKAGELVLLEGPGKTPQFITETWSRPKKGFGEKITASLKSTEFSTKPYDPEPSLGYTDFSGFGGKSEYTFKFGPKKGVKFGDDILIRGKGPTLAVVESFTGKDVLSQSLGKDTLKLNLGTDKKLRIDISEKGEVSGGYFGVGLTVPGEARGILRTSPRDIFKPAPEPTFGVPGKVGEIPLVTGKAPSGIGMFKTRAIGFDTSKAFGLGKGFGSDFADDTGTGFDFSSDFDFKLDLKDMVDTPPPTTPGITDTPSFLPPTPQKTGPTGPPGFPGLPRWGGPQRGLGLGLIKIKPRYRRAASPTAALFNIKATKRQRKQEKFTGLELIGLR